MSPGPLGILDTLPRVKITARSYSLITRIQERIQKKRNAPKMAEQVKQLLVMPSMGHLLGMWNLSSHEGVGLRFLCDSGFGSMARDDASFVG